MKNGEVMSEMVEEMEIDETNEHALASFTKTKNGTKVRESDHNSIITKVKGLWNKRNCNTIEQKCTI